MLNNNILNIKNKRIRYIGRAAAMCWIGFGQDVLTLNRKGERLVAEYALHIQCSFRISHNNSILLTNLDMFEPNEKVIDLENFDWDIQGNNTFDICSKALTELFENNQIVVKDVNVSKIGDLTITLSNNYVIEVFINANFDDEAWRFFLSGSDEEHFVIKRN